MKYIKWFVMPITLIIVFCFLPSLVNAQPDPGGDPDAAVPIDGGLSLLLAAGVGYGVKKVRDYRKKINKEKDLSEEIK